MMTSSTFRIEDDRNNPTSNEYGVVAIVGDSAAPVADDWHFIVTDGILYLQRYESGGWVEYGTYGASTIFPDLGLDTPGRRIFFEDAAGDRHTLIAPANSDRKGVSVGNFDGIQALLSSGPFLAAYPTDDAPILLPNINEGTDTLVGASFDVELPMGTDNRIISEVTFYLSSPEAGTIAQIKLLDLEDNLLTFNVSDHTFIERQAGLEVIDGANTLILDPPFNSPINTQFKGQLNFSKSVTLIGNATDKFRPKYALFAGLAHVNNLLHLPSWEERCRRQADIITKDEWITENGLIYKATETGEQTGAFDDNITLWIKLGTGISPDVMVYKGGITVAAFNALTSGNLGEVYRLNDTGTLTGGEVITTEQIGSSITIRQTFATTITSADYDHFANPLGSTSVLDSDGDTGIETERGADDDTVRVKTAGFDRVVISNTGAVSIAGATELLSDSPGNYGGYPSGALRIRSPSTGIYANACITGHSSYGGNKQLWYLGSASSSNDDIILLNRNYGAIYMQNTNGRVFILAGGHVRISTPVAIPADSNLATNELIMYMDESTGAIIFKAKKSNGAVFIRQLGDAHAGNLVVTDLGDQERLSIVTAEPTVFTSSDGLGTLTIANGSTIVSHKLKVGTTLDFAGDISVRDGDATERFSAPQGTDTPATIWSKDHSAYVEVTNGVVCAIGENFKVAGALLTQIISTVTEFNGSTFAVINGANVRFKVETDGSIKMPQVYNDTNGSAATVNILADGSLQRGASSRLLKTDIREDVSPTLALLLKPVSFAMKKGGHKHLGFIAEDAIDADPRMATCHSHIHPGLDTNGILAALTALVQQQQKDITELKDQVKALTNPRSNP